MQRTRGRWRTVLLVVGAVGFVAALLVGWPAWVAHRTWSRLDSAASRLDVPSGFTELDRVRSGDGFCFVSCTGGGEAVLTVVMDPGSLSEDEACRRVEQAVRQLADDSEAASDSMSYGLRCDISGSLSGSLSVRGAVMRRDDIECPEPSVGCGPRWMDTMPVPDLPVIAWVEFNSGIE